jgi:hypothetical protein
MTDANRDLIAEIDRLEGALLLGWNPPALWAGEPLMKLLSMVAGAVSGVFMREHPDMVMPTEDVLAAIDAVLQCDPRPSEERQAEEANK